MLAGSANTPTSKSSNYTTKDSIEEIAQALAKLIKDNKAPGKPKNDGPDENNPAKASEEKSSKTTEDDKVTEDKRGEKKPEPKQIPTKPVDAKDTKMSHVQRLQMRQVSN